MQQKDTLVLPNRECAKTCGFDPNNTNLTITSGLDLPSGMNPRPSPQNREYSMSFTIEKGSVKNEGHNEKRSQVRETILMFTN